MHLLSTLFSIISLRPYISSNMMVVIWRAAGNINFCSLSSSLKWYVSQKVVNLSVDINDSISSPSSLPYSQLHRLLKLSKAPLLFIHSHHSTLHTNFSCIGISFSLVFTEWSLPSLSHLPVSLCPRRGSSLLPPPLSSSSSSSSPLSSLFSWMAQRCKWPIG